MSGRGAFVTLEGGEGCGKSTQAALLVARIGAHGARVLALREPGGTEVGDGLRAILLDPAHHGVMDPWAELLMYEAARAQLVGERIAPALEDGVVVVCDRYYDSTTAYQGYGRGLDLGRVLELNTFAARDAAPDVTVVLDIDPVLGLERATGGGADRLEREDVEFHRRVRAGFLTIAAIEPDRVRVVDAAGTPDEVAERVWAAVSGPLAEAGVLCGP